MSVYSRLHRELKIPDGYHADAEAGSITGRQRAEAIHDLRKESELYERDDAEALLNAITRKLTRLQAPPVKQSSIDDAIRQPKRKRQPKRFLDPNFEAKEAERLARKDKIRAFILENPKAGPTAIGKMFGCDESTVRFYKRELKAEGNSDD